MILLIGVNQISKRSGNDCSGIAFELQQVRKRQQGSIVESNQIVDVQTTSPLEAIHNVVLLPDRGAGQKMAWEIDSLDVESQSGRNENVDCCQTDRDPPFLFDHINQIAVQGIVVIRFGSPELFFCKEEVSKSESILLLVRGLKFRTESVQEFR